MPITKRYSYPTDLVKLLIPVFLSFPLLFIVNDLYAATALDSLQEVTASLESVVVPEPATPTSPSATVGPEAMADEPASQSTRDLVFYVWSDSHFGAYDYSDPLRLTIMDRLNGLVGKQYPSPFRNDRVAKPAFLLSCGDITENGAQESWDAPSLGAHRSYIQTVKRLSPGIRTYEALGNHDSRKDANVRANVVEKQGNTYYSFNEQGIHFVILDPYPVNNTAAPDFDETQLAWLKQDLDALPGNAPVIIATHVQPDSAQADMDRTSKPGAASSQALYEIVKNKNVLAFLHGHLHRTNKLSWRGIDVVEPAGFAYPMPNYAGSGNTIVGVVRIQDNRITVLKYDWNLDAFASSPVLLDKTFRSADEALPGPVRLAALQQETLI